MMADPLGKSLPCKVSTQASFRTVIVGDLRAETHKIHSLAFAVVDLVDHSESFHCYNFLVTE